MMHNAQGAYYNMGGWVNPEDVMVSEVRLSQKDKHHVAPLTWASRRSQIHGDRGRGGARGSSFKEDRASVHKDGKVWRWMVVTAA